MSSVDNIKKFTYFAPQHGNNQLISQASFTCRLWKRYLTVAQHTQSLKARQYITSRLFSFEVIATDLQFKQQLLVLTKSRTPGLFFPWQFNRCLYAKLKVTCTEFRRAAFTLPGQAHLEHPGPSELFHFHVHLLHWTQDPWIQSL